MWDVIIIGGPTASGKSALSQQLAKYFDTVIISADSRQVYRGMDIGTAKATPTDRAVVPHYLLDICETRQSYSVGQFEEDVLKILAELLPEKKPVFVVGGTGLYIRALLEGLDEFPAVSEDKIQEIREFYKNEGIEGLQIRLKKLDPDYFMQVDMANPHRLIRAITVSESGSKPFSHYRKGKNTKRPYRFLPIFLLSETKDIYENINQRVVKMMEAGLLEEARHLFAQQDQIALQTVGYQELFEYFEGKYSLEEATLRIQQNTRRYAKRQMTWFRKEPWWQILPSRPYETQFERALHLIQQETIT